jgi:PQQ-dependent dehydrogenase (methanol/ethanol family)
MYNQTYDGQRYSALTQINTGNVRELKEACRVRLGEIGGFGGSPVVVKGVLYITFRNATVALNPVDCGVIWKTLYVPEQNEPIASGNRGVAYFDGRLFRGTGDGRLIALDAATGQELWRARPADPTVGEWLTAAPIVWDRKVFIGVAGSDFGIRGRMLAFQADTGALAWQFNTVPQAAEFGADTWKGDSAQTGGGGMWSTVTLDPATGELFVPVGNPAPDFFLASRFVKSRVGQNLFTNSVVALDARSGRLQWHFQATPSDDRDLDQAAAPMLFTLGNGTKVLAAASKDGYLRVVDRSTHKLVYRVPVTTIRNEHKPVTEKGVEACPGIVGGVQWNGPAYDARQKSIVVGAVDWCTFLQRDPKAEYKRGGGFYGGRFTSLMTPTPSGWITSVDADTGTVRWKFHAPAPVVSAVTPTAGGVTFAGDLKGNLYAFDSADGKVLFQSATGGGLAGGIVTYSIGQKQYVAVTSGNLSRAVWGTTGLPHIVIYSIGDASAAPGAAASLPEVSVVRGQGAFMSICRACHGEGGPAPSLAGVSKRLSHEQLTEQVRSPRKLANGGAASMPAFDIATLSQEDLLDLLAYLDRI